MTGVTVVNFSHPLTDPQRTALARELDLRIERVIDVPTHFDHARSFADQAMTLLEPVDIAWETTPLVVNLPSFSPIVAVLLAQLHGLLGHFPTVIRLRPVTGTIPAQFEVAELLSLNDIRNDSRSKRERRRSAFEEITHHHE